MKKNPFFGEDPDSVMMLLQFIQVKFFSPEFTFVRQFDQTNKSIYFIGDGFGNIYN